MKKLLATSVLGLLAAGAMAQGTVNFANNGNQPGTTTPLGRVYLGSVGTLADNTVDVQLYYNGAAVSGVSAVKSSAGAGTGQFLGGSVTLANVTAGSTVNLDVKAWVASTGATYDLASSKGESGSFAYVTGGGGAPPASPTTLLGMPSFVVAVPEPTTLALGAIGLGALLIRRRK